MLPNVSEKQLAEASRVSASFSRGASGPLFKHSADFTGQAEVVDDKGQRGSQPLSKLARSESTRVSFEDPTALKSGMKASGRFEKTDSQKTIDGAPAAPPDDEGRRLSRVSFQDSHMEIPTKLNALGLISDTIEENGQDMSSLDSMDSCDSDHVPSAEERSPEDEGWDIELLKCWEKWVPRRSGNSKFNKKRSFADDGKSTKNPAQAMITLNERYNLTTGAQEPANAVTEASVILDNEGQPRWERLWARCIIPPQRRLPWEICGMLFLGYDLLAIPWQVFDPPENTLYYIMTWSSTIFWTLDIGVSFTAGYHQEGVVEMRPRWIAKHYMKGGFAFDFFVVSIDYLISMARILGTFFLEGTSVSYMRFAKIVKFFRLLRLVRLLKVQGTFHDFVERVDDETIVIIMGVFKILIAIMVINHLIACSWYGIGISDIYETSWVKTNEINPEDRMYAYTTALHWSLTQFTPASMEVVPENTGERAFTVSVLVFAMVAFSSFISSITGAMTRIRQIDHERLEMLSSLRRYLYENHVSKMLVARTMGSVNSSMKKSKRRFHEKDVQLLQLLPWSLKADLRDEIFTRTFSHHPFMAQICTSPEHRTQRRRLFHTGLHEQSLPVSHELFTPSYVADRIYFVLNGALSFTEECDAAVFETASEDQRDSSPNPGSPTTSSSIGPTRTGDLRFSTSNPGARPHRDGSMTSASTLSEGMWACEAALWIKWRHVGQLVAMTHCEVVGIKACKFQEIMYTQQCVRYAQEFALFFQNDNNSEDLTDTWADLEILEDMAWCAFETEVEEVEASDVYDQMDHGKVKRSASEDNKQPIPSLTPPSTRKSSSSLTPRSTFGVFSGAANTNLISAAFSKVTDVWHSRNSTGKGQFQVGAKKGNRVSQSGGAFTPRSTNLSIQEGFYHPDSGFKRSSMMSSMEVPQRRSNGSMNSASSWESEPELGAIPEGSRHGSECSIIRKVDFGETSAAKGGSRGSFEEAQEESVSSWKPGSFSKTGTELAILPGVTC